MKGKDARQPQRTRFDMFDPEVFDADPEDAALQQLKRLERQEAYLQRKPQEKLRIAHEQKKAEILAWFFEHGIIPVKENGEYVLKIYVSMTIYNLLITTWQQLIISLSDRYGEYLSLDFKAENNEKKLILTLTKITLSEYDIVYFNSLKEACVLSDWEQCKGNSIK